MNLLTRWTPHDLHFKGRQPLNHEQLLKDDITTVIIPLQVNGDWAEAEYAGWKEMDHVVGAEVWSRGAARVVRDADDKMV